MTICVDVIREVWHDSEGCIEVRPDEGCISIKTPNEKSIKWFGKIDILLCTDVARALGQVLIDTANEMEKNNG